MDPYKVLRISRNPDGSITRGLSFPLSPPSSDAGVLCRDLPLNPARRTTLRLFLPSPSPPSASKLPVIVYFHGGGFILFRSATGPVHASCARLAAELPALVLSVDYRLAPEHRLPAAFEDAIDALLWLRAHATGASTEGNLPLPLTDCADFSRCFLMGNSAGAAIAFHAAVLAAALPEPLDPVNIVGLVLDQPYFGGIERTESELRLKDDKIIPLPANDLMWELALPDGADRDHEYSNPLKNEEKLFAGLRNFPRCLVRGHTGDPLFDRQREFARMLERRGVSVVASLESDGCHSVELFDPSKEEEAVAEVKRFVRGEDGIATSSAAVIALHKLSEIVNMSILQHLFYYPLLPSVFIAGMFASACAFAVVVSFTEARGLNFTYSKFSPSAASGGKRSIRCLPSRAGMLLIYTPALVTAAAAALLPGALSGERSWLLCFILFVHFFKRVLEVLFIHQYSGHVPLNTALQISPGYLTATACLLHAQNLAIHPPTLDLQLAGILLFLAGITGNFYHHHLLAGLRTNNNNKKGDKSYKIPKGGLFGLVVCPHYLFEAIEFVGIALISQTLFASGVLVGTLGYLMGRSWATRKWYLAKFHGEFPKHVKALIPYVF